MIQGTGSNVGKSLLVAGILRALRLRGLNVAPFKPQNMSNNAAATGDGGEIGRAQALQAKAADVAPHTDMNPVLLKPQSETGAQIIVRGQHRATMDARRYSSYRTKLMPEILESFHRLREAVDLVVVEGAGSPAEINLRDGDIANMGFATTANVPVVLAGDIDRGGVIAQLVGTKVVLPKSDADQVKGFFVNKFRGDPSLFADGMTAIEAKTGWPSLGLIPWFDQSHKLPAEDVLDIRSTSGGAIKIAVPKFARMANFDDLDPLANEPNVSVEIIPPGRPLPRDCDLVLLPGSKSTIAELAHFRAQGWDIDLAAHIRAGGHVLGICGGYQMLGATVSDPDGIEGTPGSVPGLGHLDVSTQMVAQKTVRPVSGTQISDETAIAGYEIHIGQTKLHSDAAPWLTVEGRPEGAQSRSGRLRGTYVHGLFAQDAFRRSFLRQFDHDIALGTYEADVDRVLDNLAAHIETHVDLDQLIAMAL